MGIDPEEGKPHYAIFQLADPVQLQPQTRMQILLKQSHGRKHLIGAFRIGLSDAEPGQLTALPLPVNEALRRPAAERSESEKLTLAAYWLRSVTESEIKQLPPQQVVYAAAIQSRYQLEMATINLHLCPRPRWSMCFIAVNSTSHVRRLGPGYSLDRGLAISLRVGQWWEGSRAKGRVGKLDC